MYSKNDAVTHIGASVWPKLAFITYYKDDYALHTFDLKEPLHTVASADFGEPGPITDFQAPMQHTLVAENKTKKRRFDS